MQDNIYSRRMDKGDRDRVKDDESQQKDSRFSKVSTALRSIGNAILEYTIYAQLRHDSREQLRFCLRFESDL